MRKKVLAVFLTGLVILAIALSCSPSRPAEVPGSETPRPETEEPALILDSDGDGYSDEFEIKIAKTDPLVPNERYALLVDTWPTPFEEEEMYRFLTEKEKVPAGNIITLFSIEATRANIKKALGQLTEKVTENDILFVAITAHGWMFGENEEIKTSIPLPGEVYLLTYRELDEYLDKIKARAMTVMITACGSERDSLFNTLREKSRIIITTDIGNLLVDFLEAMGAKITLDVSWRAALIGEIVPEGPNRGPGILYPSEGSGYAWRALQPKDKVVKKNYSSLAEVFQAIDKDRNGYLSIGEAIAWVDWLRWEVYKEEPGDIKNPCRIDNLAAASELYFGDYQPKELK